MSDRMLSILNSLFAPHAILPIINQSTLEHVVFLQYKPPHISPFTPKHSKAPNLRQHPASIGTPHHTLQKAVLIIPSFSQPFVQSRSLRLLVLARQEPTSPQDFPKIGIILLPLNPVSRLQLHTANPPHG